MICLFLQPLIHNFVCQSLPLSNVMYMYQFICKMKFLISKLANVLSIFGSENRHFEHFLGIFFIQLTSDGGSLQWCIYSTFTFICVYNLATFCSNKTDNFINIYILRNMWMFLVFYGNSWVVDGGNKMWSLM